MNGPGSHDGPVKQSRAGGPAFEGIPTGFTAAPGTKEGRAFGPAFRFRFPSRPVFPAWPCCGGQEEGISFFSRRAFTTTLTNREIWSSLPEGFTASTVDRQTMSFVFPS